MPLIQLEGISKIYPMAGGDVHALREVSLTINAGDFLSVVGSSGSGKTTLLYLLGLLTSPSRGSYRLHDHSVEELSDRDLSAIRGREVGFVFQSFHLVPQLSVLENVLLAARYAAPDGNGASTKQARELIDRVGLGHRFRHRPTELSGGEMQRVAVARALLTQPSLILADEPTGNLDETNGDQIFELLQTLNEEGKTIVLVTHDLQLASRTQRQIRLRDGEVIHDAS
ncbi:MAG: ABC transporter ATP-binding protein [Planctomycetota bacterium]